MSFCAILITVRSFNKTSEAVAISDSSFNLAIARDKTADSIFNITHQPFLEAGNPIIVTFEIGKQIEIIVTLTNISDIPVKMISEQIADLYIADSTIQISQIINHFDSPRQRNFYLTKGMESDSKFFFIQPMTEANYNDINTSKQSMYLAKKIKYVNLITGTKRVYIFCLKLNPVKNSKMYPNGTYYQLLYNENYDEK